jgi:D-alanine transaminase
MQRVGCYTTARVTGGRVERLERHARRLARDADRVGLPPPDRAAIEATAIARARAALGRGDGIVRIEWSAAPPDPPVLLVATRPLGFDGSRWRAITASIPHPGPEARRGAKAIGVVAWEAARAEALAARVDEALLFDEAGRLVEGSRTNLIVVAQTGGAWTPAPALGAVEGLGLACVQEAVPEIRASEGLDRATLRSALELVAVNAVRGAVAVVALDGEPIGDGRPGPLARRLRSLFFRTPPP